jgi:hypothetical protein
MVGLNGHDGQHSQYNPPDIMGELTANLVADEVNPALTQLVTFCMAPVWHGAHPMPLQESPTQQPNEELAVPLYAAAR